MPTLRTPTHGGPPTVYDALRDLQTIHGVTGAPAIYLTPAMYHHLAQQAGDMLDWQGHPLIIIDTVEHAEEQP